MKNKVSDNIVATFSYLCAVWHPCTMQQIIVYYSRFSKWPFSIHVSSPFSIRYPPLPLGIAPRAGVLLIGAPTRQATQLDTSHGRT